MTDDELAAQLTAAHAAIERGKYEQALGVLLAVWQATHAPRIATLIERTGARLKRRPLGQATLKQMQARWMEMAAKRDPADVPRLLAGLASGGVAQALLRLGELAEFPDDPRLARGLVTFLEHPPYSQGTTFAQLTEIARGLIDRSAPADDRVFDGSAAGALQTVEAAFAGEQSADALLDAIYAAPDDDAPRLVYADWLLEQGDPLGELISLQLQRDKPPEAAAREAELLPKLLPRITGPLNKVTRSDRIVRRGFLAAVTLDPTNRRSMITASTAREWLTVEEIRVQVASFIDVDTFNGPMFRNVRRLRRVPHEILTHLARAGVPPRLELVTCPPFALPHQVLEVLEAPGALASLRRFGCEAWLPVDLAQRVAHSALTRGLEQLALANDPTLTDELDAWLVALTPTSIVDLTFSHYRGRRVLHRAAPDQPWRVA